MTTLCGEDDLRAENKRLRQMLEAVRSRVIIDHYTGTTPDSPHYGSCRLCGWVWCYGEAELHEETCPMEEKV